MKILVLDNYDSFTYNLVQMVEQIVEKEFVYVFKNDEISLEEVEKYDKIILSPGPGVPSEAGILLDVIKEFAPKKPILGGPCGAVSSRKCIDTLWGEDFGEFFKGLKIF